MYLFENQANTLKSLSKKETNTHTNKVDLYGGERAAKT